MLPTSEIGCVVGCASDATGRGEIAGSNSAQVTGEASRLLEDVAAGLLTRCIARRNMGDLMRHHAGEFRFLVCCQN